VIEVKTQAQLEKALKKTNGGRDDLIVIVGNGHFEFTEGSPRVETWGSSSPTVVTWGSSSPTVVTRESSSPTVVTRESSSLAGAIGKFSHPQFWRHGDSKIRIPGAVILEPPKIENGEDWCEFYGVEIREYSEVAKHGVGASDPDNTDGEKPPFYAADETGGEDGLPVAILFKAVGEGFISQHGCDYSPGTSPSAPDWDGGKEECGGGLHFSPHPVMAEEFHDDPDHFVACPVLLSEIVVHPDGTYPAKCKAPRVAAPCWEVDRDGQKIEAGE
jgi:hypothetical protein